MKKILIFATALVIGLSFTSCNKYLEEKPTSDIGPEQVGDSKEAVDLWVTGVYSNWLYDMFCWSNFPRNLELDNDYISGPSWLFGALGVGNFSGDEGDIDKIWTGGYNLINDANMAIRYIQAMSNVDEDYKNNAIGEMLFQKAFCYFLIVRAFGACPYYETDVNNGADFFKPRTPIAEIYGHIIEMLEEAIPMMYSYDNANYQAGHVSAGGAAGLLAKVYATMASAAMPEGTIVTVRTGTPYDTETDIEGNEIKVCRVPEAMDFKKTAVAGYESFDAAECYQKAAYWAGKIMNGDFGSYKLCDYDNLWSKSNREDPEFMWAVRSLNGDEKYCTHVHTYFCGYKSTAGSEYIYSGGWIGNTNNWYQLFDEDDYRVSKGIRHTWRYYYQESYNGVFFYPQSWKTKITGMDVYGNYVQEPDPAYPQEDGNGAIVYQYNTSYECLAFTKKYEDCENDATDYADSQYPFLRLADVMLIYAEALNELDQRDQAVEYLNKVRERSNAKLQETVPSQERLRSLILEERAKELACEGDRRWDLIRWGIYLDAMNAVGRDDSDLDKTRQEKHLLYPIPVTEVNANPYITVNNPGW